MEKELNNKSRRDNEHDISEGATILPFKRPQTTELAKAMLRHPASGGETLEQTVRRLGLPTIDDEDYEQ